jgi:anti-sigma regulatory factor (Ser/Thr protein kinase)
MREERLKQLDEKAWIKLTIDYHPDEEQLIMVLEHNGKGFDYQHSVNVDDESLSYGRGILLTRELCRSLEYSKKGCCVTAVYALNDEHHFPSSA